MVIYELPNITTGIDQAVTGTVTAVPGLSSGILFFVFMVIFLSGTASQKRRQGYVDFPMWVLMSALPTLFLGLIFSLQEGMIDIVTLGILVSLNVISGLWFFLSKGRGEVA